MTSPNNTKQNKKKLIKAMEQSLGIVTNACKKANVCRTTYYEYYKTDPEFKRQIDEIENIALDHVESKLYDQIDDDDTTAIIFYLKTKGKKRGYIERIEQDNSGVFRVITSTS